jgi:hypothetical protein
MVSETVNYDALSEVDALQRDESKATSDSVELAEAAAAMFREGLIALGWTPPGVAVEGHTLPFDGQMYAQVETFGTSDSPDDPIGNSGSETLTTNLDDPGVNLITSATAENVLMQKPILDIDYPAWLIPSTRPGHFHLYIDRAIPKDKYLAMVTAMAEAGLVEEGYAGAAERRGYTGVRLPWIKKEPVEPKPITHHWDNRGSTAFIDVCDGCGHPCSSHVFGGHGAARPMWLVEGHAVSVSCKHCDDDDSYTREGIAA